MTVISSTHARGVLPDGHRASLRAFHNSPSVEALIAQCDFTLVAGSRLRSNETRSWTLELPSPRVQIDIDPAAASRNYLMDNTLIADCSALLGALAEKRRAASGATPSGTHRCSWWSRRLNRVCASSAAPMRSSTTPLKSPAAGRPAGARYHRFRQPVGQSSVPR